MSRELSPNKPALSKSSPEEQPAEVYVAQARRQYAESTENIEIDDEPEVSVANGGAWVGAWVWVDREVAGLRGNKRGRIVKA